MKSELVTRIAVVDGNPEDRKEISGSVGTTGFLVSEFETAEAFQRAVREDLPDLVVSEVRLPDTSGFSLCRLLREEEATRNLPIILVGRWSSEMDRIFAFECGADDFVERPLSQRELLCRVNVLLKHARRAKSVHPALEGLNGIGRHSQPGGLPNATEYASRFRDLTAREAAILVELVRADGRTLSRENLIQAIWAGEPQPSDRCIDTHVKSLRRKLAGAEGEIETVRGFGYRFVCERAIGVAH